MRRFAAVNGRAEASSLRQRSGADPPFPRQKLLDMLHRTVGLSYAERRTSCYRFLQVIVTKRFRRLARLLLGCVVGVAMVVDERRRPGSPDDAVQCHARSRFILRQCTRDDIGGFLPSIASVVDRTWSGLRVHVHRARSRPAARPCLRFVPFFVFVTYARLISGLLEALNE